MKQKFRKLSFVHICKDMPEEMQFFDSDFDAIVEGTYSQLYGGTNINSYSLYQIEDGDIVDNISWYYEKQLTLLPNQDRDKAEEMTEKFNFENPD
ncbi:MAG TPA: hypothetical protein ENH82_07775 [bacterium]|nr:hypothetical protein [bacterium]